MKNRFSEILKQFKPRTDYMDLRQEIIQVTSFSFSREELTRLSQREESGYSVRACRNGGWGFTSLNRPDSLQEYAGRAAEYAHRLGTGRTRLAPVEPVTDTVTPEMGLDPRTIALDKKLELFRSYTARCLDSSPAIVNASAAYFEIHRTILYMNSEGTCIHQEKLDIGAAVTPYAQKNGHTQFLTVSFGSSADASGVFQLAGNIDTACRTSEMLLNAKPVRGGKYTVIIDPVLAGTFVHEAFGHMSEADEYHRNQRLREIFTMGRQFGPECLHIYDSGIDPGTRGFIRYDDEGVPGQKTWLIQNGELTGRLHSRESAARFNESPTGNARTLNYRFPPICRMRNTAIAPGNASFEDLLDGITEGVYAVDTHGGSGGEMFSFDAGYGYMIRNGKLAEPVRDVQLSGNLFKTLHNIQRIGSDFTVVDDAGGCGKGPQFPLETTCSAPHVRISDVTVGGGE